MTDSAAAKVTITVYPNGPFLVRGDAEIVSPDGRAMPRTRRTVAICRCGASAIKPFCDGSHKAIGFRTDDEGREEPEAPDYDHAET